MVIKNLLLLKFEPDLIRLYRVCVIFQANAILHLGMDTEDTNLNVSNISSMGVGVSSRGKGKLNLNG